MSTAVNLASLTRATKNGWMITTPTCALPTEPVAFDSQEEAIKAITRRIDTRVHDLVSRMRYARRDIPLETLSQIAVLEITRCVGV